MEEDAGEEGGGHLPASARTRGNARQRGKGITYLHPPGGGAEGTHLRQRDMLVPVPAKVRCGGGWRGGTCLSQSDVLVPVAAKVRADGGLRLAHPPAGGGTRAPPVHTFCSLAAAAASRRKGCWSTSALALAWAFIIIIIITSALSGPAVFACAHVYVSVGRQNNRA